MLGPGSVVLKFRVKVQKVNSFDFMQEPITCRLSFILVGLRGVVSLRRLHQDLIDSDVDKDIYAEILQVSSSEKPPGP